MVMLGVKVVKWTLQTASDVIATPTAELAVQLYHMMQTMAYVVMAILIMRLKLFLTPQLAILCGFIPGLLKSSSSSVSSRPPSRCVSVRG